MLPPRLTRGLRRSGAPAPCWEPGALPLPPKWKSPEEERWRGSGLRPAPRRTATARARAASFFQGFGEANQLALPFIPQCQAHAPDALPQRDGRDLLQLG